MPITPSFSWSETAKFLRLEVKLTHTSCSVEAADVMCTDWFVKVNCPPMLLQLDLHGQLDSSKVSLTKTSNSIKFKVPKTISGLWGNLVSKDDKSDVEQRRKASIAQWEAANQMHREEAKETKRKDADFVFHRHWDLEKDQRKTIEHVKAEEKRIVEEDLYEWVETEADSKKSSDESRSELNNSTEGNNSDADTSVEIVSAEEGELPQTGSEGTTNASNDHGASKDGQVPRLEEITDDVQHQESAAAVSQAEQKSSGDVWTESDFASAEVSKVKRDRLRAAAQPKNELPAPRSHGKVDISFTPKPTNMPAREALEDDLENDPQKDSTPDVASLDDVVWLKERGSHFFKLQDYAAAVNAYSAAIELQPKALEHTLNRSACYIQLANFARAIADAADVIERLSKAKLLDEQGTANMAIALSRRGVSYWRLGMLSEGQADLEKAVALQPGNSMLAQDLASMQDGLKDAEWVSLKAQADRKFKEGNPEEAVDLYKEAINSDPGVLSVHSNIAAAYLQLKQYDLAEESCTRCLTILDPRADGGETKLALRPLVRRGNARVWLGNFEDAKDDLTRALKIDPTNEKLKVDLSLLEGGKSAPHPLQEMAVQAALQGSQ